MLYSRWWSSIFPASILSILIGAMAGVRSPAAGLDREANSTLKFSSEPPVLGYTTENAFPALTFVEPVCIAYPPGETNRLFVVEKAGRIQVVADLSEPTKTLFLDISARVNPAGEGGLLGLAFHPGYRTNGYFFVFYTLDKTTEAGTGFHDRLSRFEISPDEPNAALPDSEVPLLTQFDEANNHNGGDLHFGPDGYLYVSLGDEGAWGGQLGNAQRIDQDFFSGILRLDVDQRPDSLPPNPHPASSTNYAVPSDNPFIGVTDFNGLAVDPSRIRTEFWAVGLRNPWRFSFDFPTGQLYCGDVGQGDREEIDVIQKGGNYGWNCREGTIAFAPFGECDLPFASFIDPVLDYGRPGTNTSREGSSVIGGFVYRGSRLPELEGEYLFADNGSWNVWALHYDGTNAANFRLLTQVTTPVAVSPDPRNGDVLILDIYNGLVRRLTYQIEATGPPLPPTLSATGAFKELETLTPEAGIVPYEINVPFWSDHARKARWFSVPDINLTIGFDPTSNWLFPTGTVWIKHFEMELTNGVPESVRRLETRFLVKNNDGIHGFTYRWNAAQTDADLVDEPGQNEEISIYQTDGSVLRNQTWHYPSRSECLQCHTPVAGFALGFNTVQLNRAHDYGDGPANQIAAYSEAGYFATPATSPATLPLLSPAGDESASLEHRVRSYFQANCVQCHQPGGTTQARWDARITTPLSAAGIIEGDLVNDLGDSSNRVIQPGSLERSVLLKRISQLGQGHMPPLATSELNREAIDLLSRWITNGLNSLSVTLEAGGQVQFLFSGVPERAYRIESSADLSSWQTVATVTASPTGAVEYSESTAAMPTSRFYRVAWP